ncbi:uncharacterized protein LOC144001086 [Festucalex cinctus]
MPMMILWILLLFFAQLCSGNPTHPTCTVTCDSKECQYKFIGDDNPPCHRYQWTNGTDAPLANPKQTNNSPRSNVVQDWNDKYLHLNVCVENVHRIRDCPRENFPQVVHCPVNCSRSHDISPTRRRYVFYIPLLLFSLASLFLLGFACSYRYHKPNILQPESESES